MNAKKNNIPVKTNNVNFVQVVDDSKEVIIKPTKVSEIASKQATEASELIPKSISKDKLAKPIVSAKAEKTMTLSTEEKYAAKQQRYLKNRAARQAKLQAKKDKFLARIIEENKLDESFTKEMAESMWYDEHDIENRVIGGYVTRTYDKVNKVWKKTSEFKWSLVAIKAKETLATIRKSRTVTETVTNVDGSTFTRKIVLKPVFDKKTNTRSIELSRERFKAHTEKLKANKEAPVVKIKKPNLFLEIRKRSVENPEEFYAAQTLPFKGNKKSATRKAVKIRNHYKDSKEFASVVILEYDKQIKALHPLKVIKNAA